MIKKHVKMKVVSEEQYLKLQDLLFDNEMYWGSDGFLKEKSDYYGPKHIFVYDRGFTQSSYSISTYFEIHEYEEVNINLYLKTKGTCILSPLKRRMLT